jgi:hypothetical protein
MVTLVTMHHHVYIIYNIIHIEFFKIDNIVYKSCITYMTAYYILYKKDSSFPLYLTLSPASLMALAVPPEAMRSKPAEESC